MTQSHLSRLLVTATGLLVLSGCAQTDPFQRPGIWRPMGANEMDFELQVARAADMVKGRGTDEADGDSAAAAIDRMRHDKVKPLLSNSVSKVGNAGPPAAAPAGGGGT
jgi:type IV pilus biogenesis protein CpaD/CtpE